MSGGGPCVLHLVSGELSGGAAKGAYNLHCALLEQGFPSSILSSSTHIPENAKNTYSTIHSQNDKYLNALKSRIDTLPTRLYSKRLQRIFSNNFIGYNILNHEIYKKADIIHLHWINNAFISLKTLSQIHKPIVWTIRDMWAMTGGCHYAMGKEQLCDRFQHSCGKCPTLASKTKYDLSFLNLKAKARFYPKTMQLIALSSFIQESIAKSSLLKNLPLAVIPNCIDTSVFAPFDKQIAKSLLNISTNKQIILCGANNPKDFYKGFSYLLKAFECLDSNRYFLCFFGKLDSSSIKGFEFKNFGFQHSDVMLRLLYNASDVFVAPSVLEAFGKTIAESLSCGIPVVSFDYSAPRDIIHHKHNGYLAHSFDSKNLAEGIEWILNLDSVSYENLSHNARVSVQERFSFEKIAKSYIEIYRQISNGGGDRKYHKLILISLKSTKPTLNDQDHSSPLNNPNYYKNLKAYLESCPLEFYLGASL